MKLLLAVMVVVGLCMIANFSRAEDAPAKPAPAPGAEAPKLYTFTAKDIDGKDVAIGEKYKGKVLLIVNVASKCGYTPQYKGLQELHTKYAEKGLAVMGFPCNQFGKQEPGSEDDIKGFCEQNYGVKFDLFSKVDVNGEESHPLYAYLTSDACPIEDKGPVKWNFEKFLVDREGNVIARYRSKATPAQIDADIAKALGV